MLRHRATDMRQGGSQRIGAALQCLAFVGRHCKVAYPPSRIPKIISGPKVLGHFLHVTGVKPSPPVLCWDQKEKR